MRDTVRFLLGHELHEVRRPAPTMTVLEYLRGSLGRMGTKEGCAEGDCGACTVVVGRPGDGGMRYSAVNACIQFLPMLDGCQLLTVEDLRLQGGELHPVQRAMVEHHGSQCGFCTPGFVMALWPFWRSRVPPTRERIDDALAGNLCRCTGYEPIAAAAASLYPERFAPDAIVLREDETLLRLRELAAAPTLDYEVGGQRWAAPRSADELAAVLEAAPDATVVAGATDVGLWVTKQDRPLQTLVSVAFVPELRRVEKGPDGLAIGAAATYAEATAAVLGLFPEAGELWRRIGSVQVRNAGTVGGNVANGSPIGDTPPLLIAAGASLVLRCRHERRHLPIEQFFLAYGRQDRQPGEFLEGILVPEPARGTLLRAYKISKRLDQDISAVCGAFAIRLDAEGCVRDARIAYGGMAAIPQRASGVEAALVGRAFGREAIEEAALALAQDYTPLSDMRATADYRLAVAANLLRKCWLESRGQRVNLRAVREPAFV